MKTITLDDVAYTRLRAWKRDSKESFSSVVKRVIPEPGTLGAFLSFVEENRTSTMKANDLLESSLLDRSSVKENPWT